MESRLLLDVVVAQGTAVLELFPGEDETLLIRGDSLLVLDLGFDVVDGVRWLNIERDGLAYVVMMGIGEDMVVYTRCVPAHGSWTSHWE
jgi:hypothetical protein